MSSITLTDSHVAQMIATAKRRDAEVKAADAAVRKANRNSPLVAAKKARAQQSTKHEAQSAFLVFQLRDEATGKSYSPRLRAMLEAAAAEIERLQQLPLL